MNIRIVFSFLLVFSLISCSTYKGSLTKKILKEKNYQEVKGFYDDSALDKEHPDIFPKYPGGLNGLLNDVNSIIKYPTNAVKNEIEGKVVVKYVVNKDGSIGEISLEKEADKELNEEAIRVIKSLQLWYPGFKNNKPVKVEFNQPFDFKLD